MKNDPKQAGGSELAGRLGREGRRNSRLDWEGTGASSSSDWSGSVYKEGARVGFQFAEKSLAGTTGTTCNDC